MRGHPAVRSKCDRRIFRIAKYGGEPAEFREGLPGAVAGDPRDLVQFERGAGSTAMLAVAATVLAVTAMIAPVGALAVARHRAAAAADAGALAAALALTGFSAGVPCERASQIAAAVGGVLGECQISELMVTVSVSVPTFMGAISVYATAGSPLGTSPSRDPPI